MGWELMCTCTLNGLGVSPHSTIQIDRTFFSPKYSLKIITYLFRTVGFLGFSCKGGFTST